MIPAITSMGLDRRSFHPKILILQMCPAMLNCIKYRPSDTTGKGMGPGPWSLVQGLNAKLSTEAAKR
jgi:hypothetical protein